MNKILWVDDDPLVLSSASRLLRFHGFEISTLDNPNLVLDWLSKNDVSVIISDQRMPQMTGTELLSKVKNEFPLITRIMVTGFMEPDLVRDSINFADVFRFITKPWNETELISDIQQAVTHYKKLIDQNNLTEELRQQSRTLENFAENLEEIISERTIELTQSKIEQEKKNIKMRNLAHFLNDMNSVETLEQFIQIVSLDIKKNFENVNCIFCFQNSSLQNEIHFKVKNHWNRVSPQKKWSSKKEIRINDNYDKEYLLAEIKIPLTRIITFPFMKFGELNILPHVLFISVDFPEENFKKNLDNLVEFMTSRLQVMSLAVERILFQSKIVFESQKWAETFDSIRDPLCITNKNKEVIRKNYSFTNLINNIDSNWKSDEIVQISNRFFKLRIYSIQEEQNNFFDNSLYYFQDTTDQILLYQKMIQTEKITAVGYLAGNIAHELNNPLTGIRSMAQVLSLNSSLQESQLSDLKEIDKACGRCQAIIQSLIDFTQKDQNDFEKFEINDSIKKTLPLLKSALRFHQFHLILPESNNLVLGSSHLFQQVIFNLINNACQAMQVPGKVILKLVVKKKNLVLTVEDTGPGVEESLKDKIFEPFVTTKSDFEGTGLGLSFSRNVIERMGGTLMLKKSDSNGCCFEIIVPKA